MNVSEAKEIVGGLSAPSKMPCHGYSIPASKCITGSKLMKIPGSVCYGCYAFKGNYVRFPHVQKALKRRLECINGPRWVDAMVFLINHYNEGYFRWHDSGDLQSFVHLDMIANVAKRTPHTMHWLPTREYGIVRDWLKLQKKPKNLNIRLSAHMIDGSLPKWGFKLGCTVSGVTSSNDFTCPAPFQGNNCGDCRACWSSKVKVITYHKH